MIERMGSRLGRAQAVFVSTGLLLFFVCTSSDTTLLIGQASASHSDSLPQLNDSAHVAARTRAAELRAKAEQAEAQGRNAEALADYEGALRATPKDVQLYLRIGLLKGRAGDFESAKEAFHQSIQIEPKLAEAHYDLGLAMVGGVQQNPLWKDALREFEAAFALRPGYVEPLNMSGVCLLELGNAAEAKTRFEAALRLNADSGAIHFNLGRALEASGQSDEALHEYELAIEQQGSYPNAETALGNLLLAKGDFGSAAEHFRRALAVNPEIREAHYKLAQALRHMGDSDLARLELRQVAALIQRKADAVMSSHLSNESLNRAKAGDLLGGIEDAKKALWLDPSNPIADYNLGLLLADTGNLDAAALQLRKAISLAPLQGRFYLSLARVDEKAGRLSAAREALELAIQIRPGDPELKAKLQELGAQMPQREKTATRTMEAFAWGAAEDTPNGHLAFAGELSKEGDFLGAVGELIRATGMQLERSDLHYNLAVARAQLGQLDEAELEFRKAQLQSPADVKVLLGLGATLFASKRYKEAEGEYRAVLQLEPGNQEAARMLAQCSAITKN